MEATGPLVKMRTAAQREGAGLLCSLQSGRQALLGPQGQAGSGAIRLQFRPTRLAMKRFYLHQRLKQYSRWVWKDRRWLREIRLRKGQRATQRYTACGELDQNHNSTHA